MGIYYWLECDKEGFFMKDCISKKQKEEMISKLQTYFLKERDEELGHLSAELMLDFLIDTMGPHFYNKGLEDAQRYMIERVDELLDLQK